MTRDGRSARRSPAPLCAGSFELAEQIARGGFGTVWRARSGDGRRAAVKILHAELAGARQFVARFNREAETMRSIRHPNVVEVFEHGVLADGRPYLVMEFLEGDDLADIITERGAMTLADVVHLLEPIGAALDTAHELGVVHRDVKPSNIVVCAEGEERRAVLLDFGLAKLMESEGPGLTESRMTLGTPSSMSPEQIRGEALDRRADVYALGALAYHLLTGQPVFAEASAITVSYMHLHGRRPVPSKLAPLSAAVDSIIARAMARERDDRFPDAPSLVAALAAEVAPAARAVRTDAQLAACVELVAPAELLADPDDDFLDALDDAWDRVDAHIASAGFRLVDERGNARAYSRTLPPDPGRLAAAMDQVEAIVGLVGEERSLLSARFAVGVIDDRSGLETVIAKATSGAS